MDALYDLFANYGPGALTVGLLALTGLAARHLLPMIGWRYARDVASRAMNEIVFAVNEVAQVYADAIKDARKDGKLTDEEKAEAKRLAIEAAKRNLGPPGIKRLGRVLGIEDVTDWIAGKVESAVKLTKPAPVLPKATARPRKA
jgi:hypothetical protein